MAFGQDHISCFSLRYHQRLHFERHSLEVFVLILFRQAVTNTKNCRESTLLYYDVKTMSCTVILNLQ